jgi:phospholipid/cholesterol/gamma-HCH transport system permease protein
MPGIFATVGGLVLLSRESFICFFTKKPEIRSWIIQSYYLGVKSLSIAAITSLFTGMVLALQAAFALSSFGAELFVGDLVSLSIVRELGPVLTALLVGGRVGAGITAELGSMKITQQLDAMRAMATNPVHKLVVPRLVACTVCLPILTIIACFVGILGGMFLAAVELNIEGPYYIARVLLALDLADIVSGVGKTVFFGYFIGIIACANGMRVEGGADGVGNATTETVVSASIVILISDFFLTKLFLVVTG